uniref:Uncharacterized protein n=1 Tax=Arundo donax TaxID=35708 RepID=A0A0A9A7L9_ARUDO
MRQDWVALSLQSHSNH